MALDAFIPTSKREGPFDVSLLFGLSIIRVENWVLARPHFFLASLSNRGQINSLNNMGINACILKVA